MTSQEYTQWLKGFLDAVDNYSITKKQFDSIREKLKEVDDTPIGFHIGNGGFGTPNWGGTITYPSTTPYSIPLTGTITTGGILTTSSFPSGSTITYTTSNGNSGAYTLTGNTTPTSAVFMNQSEDGDEKLLLD
jgi:hypothetical protein